ncbi:MAG TPA: hypothetical protein VN367_08355 [Chlorobaculum sp.]|jgi:hypothetical protein|nr:hypothetical protein [Chlorobaculum sp.]
MLKEAAGAVGTALIFSPIGLPIVAHGFAGLIVGAAGLQVVNLFLTDIKGAVDGLTQDKQSSGNDNKSTV